MDANETQKLVLIGAAFFQDELRPLTRFADIVRKAKDGAKRADWILTTEDLQFKAMVYGIVARLPQLQDKAIRELKILHTMSAAMSGIPVAFDELDELEDDSEYVGFRALWLAGEPPVYQRDLAWLNDPLPAVEEDSDG